MFGSMLAAEIYNVVADIADKIVEDVKREWEMYPSVKGKAICDSNIKEFAMGELLLNVFGEGQKAWILEYGKGSNMDDKDNPYLDDYWYNDDIINPLRVRPLMVGRPEGEYTDLDGNEHYSTGKMAGLIVESRDKESPFYPQEALHTIRQACIGENGNGGMLPLLLDKLGDVLLKFPYEEMFPDTINL